MPDSTAVPSTVVPLTAVLSTVAPPRRVAALQMVSGADIAANLRQVTQLLDQAQQQQALVAVLPENFALMATGQTQALGIQEADATGAVRQFLREQAALRGLWLVAGSLPCARKADGSLLKDRVLSRCWVINAQGEEVAWYDKIHLFDAQVGDAHGHYRESDTFAAGDQPLVIDTPAGRMGLAICYDLRFPELFRELARQGADWIALPSAFTYQTGEAHWELLVRARAIENQVYLCAVGQGGRHSETRITWGHSMFVDPWGRIMGALESGPGVLVTDLDAQAQAQLRQRMPVLSHRRLV